MLCDPPGGGVPVAGPVTTTSVELLASPERTAAVEPAGRTAGSVMYDREGFSPPAAASAALFPPESASLISAEVSRPVGVTPDKGVVREVVTERSKCAGPPGGAALDSTPTMADPPTTPCPGPPGIPRSVLPAPIPDMDTPTSGWVGTSICPSWAAPPIIKPTPSDEAVPCPTDEWPPALWPMSAPSAPNCAEWAGPMPTCAKPTDSCEFTPPRPSAPDPEAPSAVNAACSLSDDGSRCD